MLKQINNLLNSISYLKIKYLQVNKKLKTKEKRKPEMNPNSVGVFPPSIHGASEEAFKCGRASAQP